MPTRYVAVCGASQATAAQLDVAREVGRLLAESGAVVLNGGLGGVSEAASRRIPVAFQRPAAPPKCGKNPVALLDNGGALC